MKWSNESSFWALIFIFLCVVQCNMAGDIDRAADALEKMEQKMPAQR